MSPWIFLESFRHAHDSLSSDKSMGFHRKRGNWLGFEQNYAKLNDEKSNRNIEAWGRNLDLLAKGYDFVYTNNKILASVAVAPSPSPSKSPNSSRWIDF
jgi:hypothetical protein